MTPIRFFTDEDVYGSVARRLRELGFEATSTPEADRLGATDQTQLEWAVQEGRVLLTFNVADFARLHGEWMSLPRHHADLVVSSQRPVGDLLRRVMSLASALGAEEMRDRLEYLSNW